MADFAKAVPLLDEAEGGEVNRQDDYGGHTKYGISTREFPQINLDTLTHDEAINLLKSHYWQPYRLDEINEQAIANLMFLLLVNMNPLNAGLIIQRAVNACGRGIIILKLDGVIGSKTIQGINMLAPFWLNDRIRLEAIKYYLTLTDEDKSQIPNFRGWVRRALR